MSAQKIESDIQPITSNAASPAYTTSTQTKAHEQTYSKPQRYVPGPGEPDLPPQLAKLSNKSIDDVMAELNRSPFFMTQLDEGDGEGGENKELEALKALAYDGEPDEIATNFKNQGNSQFKLKLYQNAVEYYNKGIAVKCDDASLNASLYLNRAACNLELKNYRRCINDCKESLKYDPKNVKAYYRIARAFFALSKYDEAKEALEFSFAFDKDNKASRTLLATIEEKEAKEKANAERKEKERLEKEKNEEFLRKAVQLRNYSVINTAYPIELLQGAKLSLEDPEDYESQILMAAMIIYPTIDEFDFIADVSELSTPCEVLEIVMDRPKSWFESPQHVNFKDQKIDAYMETEEGGLIKIGKKVTFNKALSTPRPKVPLFDNALRVYLVPRVEAEEFLSKWDKKVTLKKRLEAGATLKQSI